jgi:hypothetical protein
MKVLDERYYGKCAELTLAELSNLNYRNGFIDDFGLNESL